MSYKELIDIENEIKTELNNSKYINQRNAEITEESLISKNEFAVKALLLGILAIIFSIFMGSGILAILFSISFIGGFAINIFSNYLIISDFQSATYLNNLTIKDLEKKIDSIELLIDYKKGKSVSKEELNSILSKLHKIIPENELTSIYNELNSIVKKDINNNLHMTQKEYLLNLIAQLESIASYIKINFPNNGNERIIFIENIIKEYKKIVASENINEDKILYDILDLENLINFYQEEIDKYDNYRKIKKPSY